MSFYDMTGLLLIFICLSVVAGNSDDEATNRTTDLMIWTKDKQWVKEKTKSDFKRW